MHRRLGARSRPSIRIEGVERAVELTSWKFTSDDGDTDFASAIPGQVWFLEGEAYQDTSTGSLWRFNRARAGDTVEFTVSPHGTAEPTSDDPHYTGTLVVGPRPDLGGDAGTRWFRFAFAWQLIGDPIEVTE